MSDTTRPWHAHARACGRACGTRSSLAAPQTACALVPWQPCQCGAALARRQLRPNARQAAPRHAHGAPQRTSSKWRPAAPLPYAEWWPSRFTGVRALRLRGLGAWRLDPPPFTDCGWPVLRECCGRSEVVGVLEPCLALGPWGTPA